MILAVTTGDPLGTWTARLAKALALAWSESECGKSRHDAPAFALTATDLKAPLAATPPSSFCCDLPVPLLPFVPP